MTTRQMVRCPAQILDPRSMNGRPEDDDGDDPFKAFLPRFKNLTAAGKVSLLEFFGVPVYMSMSMQNDDEQVTLKTKSTTALVTGTLMMSSSSPISRKRSAQTFGTVEAADEERWSLIAKVTF
ncbi:unnamed protein product [Linum trigynum]|uniref:Uncharacterized protein n=1 Tax=Linum trigynum TaxID=586398 RepID=A0AAV2FDC8_9ROSI